MSADCVLCSVLPCVIVQSLGCQAAAGPGCYLCCLTGVDLVNWLQCFGVKSGILPVLEEDLCGLKLRSMSTGEVLQGERDALLKLIQSMRVEYEATMRNKEEQKAELRGLKVRICLRQAWVPIWSGRLA